MPPTRLHRLLGRTFIALTLVIALIGPVALATPEASAQGTATVTISDFTFSPATLTIEAGTTVTWVNEDAVPHTATGSGGEFDTGTIAGGGSASVTFDTPGTYAYICSFHPDMVGAIVVTSGDDGADDDDGTDDDGSDDGTDGTDDGGTDDGGGEEITDLPNTGAGVTSGLGESTTTATLVSLIALLLAAGGLSLRRRPL